MVKIDDHGGLEKMQAMMTFIARLDTVYGGIVQPAAVRTVNGRTISDDQIIVWLADGNSRSPNPKTRDIRHTKEEMDEAITLWLNEVERRMRRMSQRAGRGQLLTAQAEANAAQAGGLRTAGKFLKEILHARIVSQIDNQRRALRPVEEWYALKREKEYGVPTNVVFVASGQILEKISNTSLRLVRKEEAISLTKLVGLF